MRNFISFLMIALLFGFFCASNIVVADEKAEMQAKLKEALATLKNEIRSVVSVENGGSITGTVKCRRVRQPKDVVVYIEKVGDNNYPAPEEHGIIDQMNLMFVPHVMVVQRGATVDFPNSDMVRHNVFSPPDCCNQFNLGTYDIGSSKPFVFEKTCEVPLLCNVHAEMAAYVLVLDNPYFSVTGADGVFKIENVPPGDYKLSAWHEKLRTVTQDVKVEAGKALSVGFELKKKK